jgi:hypothetical protein
MHRGEGVTIWTRRNILPETPGKDHWKSSDTHFQWNSSGGMFRGKHSYDW